MRGSWSSVSPPPPLDVAARGEGPVSRAGDDDAADLVVGIGRHYRVVKLPGKQEVHGVQDLGPVHGQNGHAFPFLHQNMLVCHRSLLGFDTQPVSLTIRACFSGRIASH